MLALASGCLRSEINALVRSSLAKLPNGEGLILYQRAGFLSKDHCVRDPCNIFSSLKVLALAPSLGPDDVDRRLCSVRALLMCTEPRALKLIEY